MRRLLGLLTCWLAFTTVAHGLTAMAAQCPASCEQELAASIADFPPLDWGVAQVLVNGERTRRWRLLAERAEGAERVEALTMSGRLDEALQEARRLMGTRPEIALAVLEALDRHLLAYRMDGAHDYRPTIVELAALARKRQAAAPREEAARIGYRLVSFENFVQQRSGDAFFQLLREVTAEYPGTQAAAEAQLTLLGAPTGGRYDAAREADAAAALAREHAGTCLAARALQRVASYAQHGDQSGRKGEDPTERFLHAFDLARELERPEYASCEPKPDSVSLIAGLYAQEPTYSPPNLDRLLAAYRQFILSHFGPDATNVQNGIGYTIVGKVGDLYRRKGAGIEGLEAFLLDVEKQVSEPDVARYLRALVPVLDPRNSLGSPSPTASSVPPPTVELLTDIARRGTGPVRRKALATLASLYRYYGDSATARRLYTQFDASYPDSGYAWVAAVRAAECAQETGDARSAATEFQSAATRFASTAMARVIGHAWAGRGFEALGQPTDALREYQAAAHGWDAAYGTYSLFAARKPVANQPTSFEAANAAWNRSSVTLRSLTLRIAQLKKTASAPGGEIIERARWLIEQGRYKEVAPLIADFGQRHRRSANASEAQYLAHKARLYDALDTLNVEGEANQAAGLTALDALAGELYDFPVCAAKLSRAIVLFTQGRREDAAARISAALSEWQLRNKLREPVSDIEKDVVAIRNAVFLPMGGSVYTQARGWNAFSWPRSRPPFFVVNPDVIVKFADGKENQLSLAQRFPALENVLQIDSEQSGILANIMSKLGGTKTREGQIFVDKRTMETPRVPVGPSVNIIAFLATFFEARPGHWGGWEFLTYPALGEIEFMDAARTKARAKVTIGYGGCDVLLEKADGVWKATGLTNTWVT